MSLQEVSMNTQVHTPYGIHLPGKHWKLSEIDWSQLSPKEAKPHLIWIIRATCLVESRADLYSSYVANVLRERTDTNDVEQIIEKWGTEEEQHGIVLRLWLERVDKVFDFDTKNKEYRKNVSYYAHTSRSVRGSIENELLCRCVVESLASAYYQAIHDSCTEPVLRDICRRLARDEARHYKMFLTLLNTERKNGRRNGWIKNFLIIYRRIKDLENSQIAYAFFCSDTAITKNYSTRCAALTFLPSLYKLYQAKHIAFAIKLIFKAINIRIPSKIIQTLAVIGFTYTRIRSTLLRTELWLKRYWRGKLMKIGSV